MGPGGETSSGGRGEPAATRPTAPALPVRLGPYLLEEVAGQGGMGLVYRARHVELGRTVAVKLVRPLERSGQEVLDRFLREARVLASLDHPNIIAVHDAGNHEGTPYIAMEYVEGPTLAQVLSSSDPGLPLLVALLARVARALEHSHGKGIVHRDLKPENILVDGAGQPRILDFGLARFVEGATELTRSGAVLGTPHYMSPEQIRGDGPASGRLSDVYSLGVILYEVLTERRPFEAEVLDTLYHRILDEDPLAPRVIDSDVPRALEAICLRCLRKEPARRYAGAGALADDLEAWLDGRPVVARAPSIAYRAARLVLRRRTPLLAGLAGVLLVLGSVAAGLWWTESRARAARDQDLAEAAEARRRRERAVPHLETGREFLRQLDRLLMTPDWEAAEVERLAERARAELGRALDEDPGNALALLEMCRAYRMEGRPEPARLEATAAIEADPTLTPAYLERAFLDLDRYEDLRHRGGAVLTENAESRRLRQSILADLAAVRNGAGEETEGVGAEGIFLFAEGRYEEAAGRLEVFARSRPGETRAWAWAGHAWFHVPGRESETIDALDRALRFRPRAVSPRFLRARARWRRGEVDGALSDYDRLLEDHPGHVLARIRRAEIRADRGDVGGAMLDLARAISVDPDSGLAYFQRGLILYGQGDLPAAIEDLDRARHLDPENLRVLLDCAVVRARLEEPDEARRLFDELLERDPDNLAGLHNRSLLRGREGDLAGALADAERLVDLSPDHARHRHHRALLRFRSGDDDGALTDLDRALAALPDDAALLLLRGRVRIRAGRPAEARDDLERVRSLPAATAAQREQAVQLLETLEDG